MKRRIFQWATVFFLLISLWVVYANVLSDDTEVRNKARAAVNAAAGCGADCQLEGLRGDRGMAQERIEYDVSGHGHFVVICRRAWLIAGDYGCEVTDRPAPRASGAPSVSASSRAR